ncbi:hypothetical protein L208DRAFT_1304451, partial [Tricholoma matsutake]
SENAENLELEVVCTEQACWFMQGFCQFALQNQVEIAEGINITECILAKEVMEDGSAPSVPSGIEALDALDDRRIIWFLEPLHQSTVQRYSGTMQHANPTGKMGYTVATFVHYAYQYSEGALVFTDIQGTMSSGQNGMILFDVMTHSSDSETGVGDYGPEGIQCWQEQHVCCKMCEGLGLVASSDEEE